jgi:hypothetical protein
MQEIVGEIFLDHVSLVPAANDEIIEAIGRIDFHDMPEYRTTSYLYHGLGPYAALFADPGAESTGK